MTKQDKREFSEYLRALSDAQVLGVLEREQTARRHAYARLAHDEALRRGLA